MKYLKLSLVVLILCISVFWLLKPVNSEDQSPVTIEINNKIIKKIPSEQSFVGVNIFDDSEINRYFLQNPEQLKLLVQTLKGLNIDTIRYPGGLNVSSFFWDVPTSDIYNALRKLPKFEQGWIIRDSLKPSDRMNFESFLQFCKKNNLKAIVQVNNHNFYDKNTNHILMLKEFKRYSNGYRIEGTGKVNWVLVNKAAEYAAQQVKWVKENGYSDVVKYWEFGNEDYLQNQFMSPGYTGTEYGKIAATFLSKMVPADPDLKSLIVGYALSEKDASKYKVNPATVKYMNNWFDSIINEPSLRKFNNNIYGISNHKYSDIAVANNNRVPFSLYKEKNLNNPKLDMKDRVDYLGEVVSKAGYKGNKVFITEFNQTNNDNRYMHSWAGSLGLAKMIISCINSKYGYHMDYHSLINYYRDVTLGFGLIHYAKDFEPNPFIKFPAAYVISLINENAKGSVLSTTFDSNQVYLSAISDGNFIKVIVLNMQESPKEINLKFNNFSSLKYVENKSLGIGVSGDFVVMEEGESMAEPSEIKLMNILENAVKVSGNKENYKINLPANTLSVFTFNR